MKTLVLSDIHANIAAFEAVLSDGQSWDRIVFLGDIANFGPYPQECVSRLKELNALCIMGNHDESIASIEPRHFWDKWAREKLSVDQREWIASFNNTEVLDDHILLVHGAYSVPYDILPNTPDGDIVNAFKNIVSPGIDEIWFGHYHYHIERTISGITYRCIRPVGHHRDKDTRASYYIYEDGMMYHKKVKYDLSQTIRGLEQVECFVDTDLLNDFIEFVQNAYHEKLLKKDLDQMKKNSLF